MADEPMGARWRKMRVREFMSKAGYSTIGTLAGDLGVSRQALTTAINGHSQPSLALTLAVAKALNAPVEEFAELAPELAFPKKVEGRSSSKLASSMKAPLLAVRLWSLARPAWGSKIPSRMGQGFLLGGVRLFVVDGSGAG